MSGRPLQLRFEPGEIAIGETPGLGNGAATRNRHPRRAIGPKSKHIAPCPGVADQQQRDALSTYFKPLVWRRALKINPGTHGFEKLQRSKPVKGQRRAGKSAWQGPRWDFSSCNPMLKKRLEPLKILNKMNGASGRTRTCNRLIRSQKLYPIELRMHNKSQQTQGFLNGRFRAFDQD